MHDLVILNGNIIDPIDGKYKANIGIKNGKIVEVSEKNLSGKSKIDVDGNIVSPGFIDIHMHEDVIEDNKIQHEILNSMALMGVTTAIGGNCGLSHISIKEYLNIMDKHGVPINYGGLVGLADIRDSVGCRDKYKSATQKEITDMIDITLKELENGALGVSFGLEYVPGTSMEELLQISHAVAKSSDKLVSCHYRFDSIRVLEAIAEMIIVARETKAKLQISHIGSGAAYGQMHEALEMIEIAHNAGVDIMADIYPYDAFCSFIGSAVFDEGCLEEWGIDYSSIEPVDGKYKGEKCNKEIFEYLRKNEPDTLVVVFAMNEDEIIEAMKHPLVMIASDGILRNGQGHPRAAGTFPRVIGKYVRDNNKLDLLTAIKKMTIMPASRVGLITKGRIAEGFDADLTVFDYSSIIDNASFQSPTKPPTGIKYVLVNGIVVVSDGILTGQLPGTGIKI